ncbi:hypothetical protein IWW38_004589 [Coemansia aciculifera]|uniref:Uncharacterized protein n=1 Tax=Coemansia aciculifera TaxID=417176 RepID=A0ACC1LY34_9FUNG|nr:hypothetical protein IWW38_004589 [Coemansia aciculifera]
MLVEFEKAGFKSSLPDLTIGVRDGNLMYTQPEQLLNRRRCRCYDVHLPGEGLYLLKYIKCRVRQSLQQGLKPTGRRFVARARSLNSQLMRKFDGFFIVKAEP